MIVVVDVSVAIKWFLAPAAKEHDHDSAVRLMMQALEGALTLWQPPHFYAEMAAALAGLKPEDALLDVQDLLELDLRVVEDEEIYALATDLTVRLNHHLFDTLYHAVALSEPDALLVTADRRYHRSACPLGQIVLLSEWDDRG